MPNNIIDMDNLIIDRMEDKKDIFPYLTPIMMYRNLPKMIHWTKI